MAGTAGRPSVYPTLLYADAKAAVKQLTEALGFTELAVYEGEDGLVQHAELVQGNGAVMLGSKAAAAASTRPCVARAPWGCTSWWTTWTATTSARWTTAWRS